MLKLLRPDAFSVSLVAVILLASLMPAAGGFADILADVTRAAIALLFFMHGAKLSREAILRGMGAVKLHVSALAITFLFFPAMALAVTALPDQVIAPEIKLGVLYLSVVPATVQSSIAFTSIAGGNVAAAVCSASLSNVLGVFLTPLLASLLIHTESSGGAVDTSSAVQTVIWLLLVPFIVGHLSRPLIGRFVDRHKPLLNRLDRGTILLVVYGAFSSAVIDGLWSRISGFDLATVVMVSMLMLAGAIFASVLVGRLWGLDHEDRVALLFCSSKKSLASGVPIAAAIYPASLVGMIILPLMVFHLIQLIVCAIIARTIGERHAHQQEPASQRA